MFCFVSSVDNHAVLSDIVKTISPVNSIFSILRFQILNSGDVQKLIIIWGNKLKNFPIFFNS